jgi:hypothetical protein
VISNYSGSAWSAYGSSAIAAINSYIDQLQAGSGNGNDNGNGNGNGNGTGNGSGTGNGNGNGTGNGNGSDTGNGSGTGNGNGTGNGSGTGNGTGVGMQVWFSGMPINMGIYSTVTAEYLVTYTTSYFYSSWSGFTAVGGVLYVNGGTQVTSGTTLIQPSDSVLILAPGSGGSGNSGELQVWFNGKPANFGVEYVLAEYLVTSTTPYSSWYEFTAAGGKLYVNDAIVTYSNVLIQSSDWVTILAPGISGSGTGGGYPIDLGTGKSILFDGPFPSEMFPSGTTAEALVISTGQVSNWSAFTAAGNELYVDNIKISTGATWILASAWIKVLK